MPFIIYGVMEGLTSTDKKTVLPLKNVTVSMHMNGCNMHVQSSAFFVAFTCTENVSVHAHECKM